MHEMERIQGCWELELVGNSCGSRRVEGTSEEARSYQVMSMMITSFIPHSNASICEFSSSPYPPKHHLIIFNKKWP
jgi:hypothetical protein